MATATALVIQMAKSAIDALVLDRLHHPPPQVPREFGGECPGGHYRLRWCRPALTFPDDAPGMVRMGMAIEGGVHLTTGRVLSCDTFVTATAAPELTHDENGWYIRLTVAAIQPGTLHLDYAGYDLASTQALLGDDLPDDELTQQLRATLLERIIQFCEEFPDIPLTYVFARQGVATSDIAVQVRPESQGAALTIILATAALNDRVASSEDSAVADAHVVPLLVTSAQNVAIRVLTATFAQTLAQHWSADKPYAPITAINVESAADVLLLSGEMAADNADEHVVFHLQARPSISDGVWSVAIAPATPNDGDAAREEDAYLAHDASLAAALAAQMRDTLTAVLAPALGEATDALAWQWHVARGTTAGVITFTPSTVSISADGMTLSGMLPLEPDAADLSDDSPNVDLAVSTGPADPLATAPSSSVITVRAVQQYGVTMPIDYAWQTSLAVSLATEHGALLELPSMPTDTDTAPQQTRKLPRGIVAVTATLIDGFGRIGQAVIEIDLTAPIANSVMTGETARVGVLADRFSGNADTNPTSLTPTPPYAERMAATRQTRATSSVTAHSTSYRAAQTRTKSALPWNIFAAILAALALIFAFGAYQLLHSAPLASVSQRGLTPGITPTVALTPQLTVGPTATSATSGTMPTAPTSPPDAFGRFDTTTTTLQFICAGGSTPPQTITFDNNGTAPLDWSAHVIDTIGTSQPWAVVSPTSGTLTTQAGNTATLTVTPATGFCAATTPTSFRIQLTAPNAVPLTITATHTAAATATPVSPSPTPTVGM